MVNYGGSQAFTITANTGYHIADVLVDGSSVGAVTSYTFTNITANHTISASFAINTYTITVTQGADGTITPGTTVVDSGADQVFTITPDANYHIDDVLVNGVSVGAVETYTFENVTNDGTITASFAIYTYNLTVTNSIGGSVTQPGEGTFHYPVGEVVDLLAVPLTGYEFGSWTGDVAGVNDAATTITMNDDEVIYANFIAFSAPENVSVTAADPGVESVTVITEPVEGLNVTQMPADIDPQEAYVVTPTGTSGNFTLTFTGVANASSIRVYKVVDDTWTLLESTVIDATTIEVTMAVADPIIVFALPEAISVTLPAGWNLLSTPIKLDADSDTLEQIFGESLENIEVSWRWNTQSQQFEVPTGYQLSPLEAVYLKVSSNTSAVAEFIPSQQISELPSRELQTGLNLIGIAEAWEAGEFPALPLDDALISIAEAEGGLTGYTMVVSPSHNQPGWDYSLGGEIQDLLPYEGYWVVMGNAATLYGSSTTPIQ